MGRKRTVDVDGCFMDDAEHPGNSQKTSCQTTFPEVCLVDIKENVNGKVNS